MAVRVEARARDITTAATYLLAPSGLDLVHGPRLAPRVRRRYDGSMRRRTGGRRVGRAGAGRRRGPISERRRQPLGTKETLTVDSPPAGCTANGMRCTPHWPPFACVRICWRCLTVLSDHRQLGGTARKGGRNHDRLPRICQRDGKRGGQVRYFVALSLVGAGLTGAGPQIRRVRLAVYSTGAVEGD